MRRKKSSDRKKIRVTLDLSPPFYERLVELEQLVDAGTKANVIRQALQLYDYIARRSLDGWAFQAEKDGEKERVVFAGAVPGQ